MCLSVTRIQDVLAVVSLFEEAGRHFNVAVFGASVCTDHVWNTSKRDNRVSKVSAYMKWIIIRRGNV